MLHRLCISLSHIGFCAGLSILYGGTAIAAPDLVIQKSDSSIEFISCEEDQPLAKGRIVMRNEGDSDANLRQAEDFFRSFTAVYVPENIDLIDKGKKRTKMEPREQRSVEFELGRRKIKRGRNYNAFVPTTTTTGYPPDQRDLSDDQVKEIQAFLKDRGYRISTVDGDWGRQTTNAMRAFQRGSSISPANGQWNEETAAVISKLTASGGEEVSGNEKDSEGRTKITIFAVVDPYNLIQESNEANNIVTYTGYLDCD